MYYQTPQHWMKIESHRCLSLISFKYFGKLSLNWINIWILHHANRSWIEKPTSWTASAFAEMSSWLPSSESSYHDLRAQRDYSDSRIWSESTWRSHYAEAKQLWVWSVSGWETSALSPWCIAVSSIMAERFNQLFESAQGNSLRGWTCYVAIHSEAGIICHSPF